MTKTFEGDYELEEAFPTQVGAFFDQGRLPFPAIPGLSPAKTEGYAAIAKSFEFAMKRCVSIWSLPSELIFWTALHSSCIHQARVDLGLKVIDTSKDQSSEIVELHQKLYMEAIERTLGRGDAWFRNHVHEFGTAELKFFTERELNIPYTPWAQKRLGEGVEAILGTMVMSTYAAFETLLTDLWECALNRNDELANEYIKKHKKDASIGDDLLRYGHDLKGKMGTVFIRKERAQGFSDFKKLFTDVFGEEAEAAFVGSTEVYQAEQVRHLLAHRGGVVDDRFRDKMKNFPDYQHLKVGEKLDLKGPAVRNHIAACTECGASVFYFVDDWTEARDKKDSQAT